ncbi:flagellar hook-associated protein FlgK [Solimicrobium silvestre]|uniref:Flagellar hook-associated protein 1 n=1 Tax=Solimicrobium silvestre TaxID=2099400 RepID=A0A2S9GVT8_9BURK|nr:flagellar hook-associated protein FlgK [Solimicrobium silvestre]PRC91821.1 Flagellar hook-associated protein FlgK [Solimicrobium silvestre]
MGVNILQIGTSGLQAAEIGIATTGQNISNANTPGYNQEVTQQATSPEQGFSFGFLGQGTQVDTITRDFNALLAQQINTTQSASSQITSYSNQITPIDNMIANPSAGLSPVLQSFFSSLQNLSSNPAGVASLQTAMSGAQTLVAQFQSLQTELSQSSSNVNSQISDEVNTINTDAQQLATVNSAIQVAYGTANNQPPNALLDQRDALVNSLSKETQVTVVPVGNQYNVFIGNGQPLVVGATASTLQTVPSAANPANLEVAYTINGNAVPIGESSLPGGTLGGLFAFRTNSLEPIQNALGQVAIVLGSNLNAQNELGQTINGTMGQALFTVASPVVNANTGNTGNAVISAAITNPSALTADNYSLTYNGGNYSITDTTTNTVKSTFAAFPAVPTAGVNVIDGVTYTLTSGAMAAGDSVLVSPTFGGAAGFGLATTDPTQIASAAPIATSSATTNTGTGVMTPGSVTTGYTPAAVAPPITLTYAALTNSLSGFPVGSTVVTTVNGVSTTYAGYVAGTPIPYTSGMSMTFNNMAVGLSGIPANGDTYTVGPNTNGKGDNRNVLLMNALLTQNTMNNGTTTYQGAYAQMVNSVGNTTSQLTTTGTTETNLLTAAQQQQQSVSGVNLDQETVNLLQYQQVYEACGKVIQVASQNFSTLLSLNGS